MKNCHWLINVNRNVDQNQSGATPCWWETCILCFILFFVVNTFFFTFYFINVLFIYSLWVVFYFIVVTKILKYIYKGVCMCDK